MKRPYHDILRDRAVAAQASGSRPAWLFTSDGSRLIFANAAGAALFGFANFQAAAGATVAHDLAARIARSAATLRSGGQPRMERLRGLGTPFGRPLTCTCARIETGAGPAVLVVATEAAGPMLTLGARARYLIEGNGAAAAFSADGTLLHATAEASRRLGKSVALHELDEGIETLHVGDGADEIVLAFFPAHSPPIKAGPIDAVAASQPALLDLSPIAEAITAMTRVPPQRNAYGGSSQHELTSRPDENSDDGETAERRHPLRFFWEVDAENRFTINSDEFIALAGPRTANLLGRFWGEISAKLALDPEGQVAQALVSRDTWSGIEVDWPTTDGRSVPVTLSGIPAFDRDRTFRGYRGLGVWRGTPASDERDLKSAQLEKSIAASEDVGSVNTANEAPADAPLHATNGPAQKPEDEDFASDTAPAQAAAEADPASEDVPLQTENVVPFPFTLVEPKTSALNSAERGAFRELGSRLSARLRSADELARGLMEKTDPQDDPPCLPAVTLPAAEAQAYKDALILPDEHSDDDELAAQRQVLERLPVGVLIYRGSNLLYANPAFLGFADHASLREFEEAGGLDSIAVELDSDVDDDDGQRLRIAATEGAPITHGRLVTVPVGGENAKMLTLLPASPAPAQQQQARSEADELAILLDIAADGAVTVDSGGTIVSANTRAEKLFGCENGALAGRSFGDLFAPESERVATERLDRLVRGEAIADDDSREIIGRRRQGGLVSLQLALGRADSAGTRFHALFRDTTRWKDAESEMSLARQQAEKASAAKSEFLAKISHEMRTPLNAIIGFSEVIMEERFGPVGNERYRDYLKDINTSGAHLVSLLNDLLDLSKIEAGKMELNFERVDLNEVTQQSVAIMQAQASRARVIMRTALSMSIPAIIADTRSVRQIVLNLLSNSVKFTDAGGQVIVSTAVTERGDVMLRVRDTGIGMSEKDIETALQPFRQLTTSSRTDANGTGLGLPLTKALVEANRARFSIKSAVNAGTLVEIAFPAGRVLAD